MKTTISLNRKIQAGAPHGGDILIHCACEVDLDMSNAVSSTDLLRRAGEYCRIAIEQQIELERKENPPPREPGDDDQGDDLRPGDPAYERSRRAVPSDPPRDRQDAREENQRRYRENYPAPEPSPPPDRRPSGRPGGAEGPPKSTRQFLGWFGKQDEGTKHRASSIAKAWNLPSLFREWSDEDAIALYHELSRPPGPAPWGGGQPQQNGTPTNGRAY
jgi:hypothetical protein